MSQDKIMEESWKRRMERRRAELAREDEEARERAYKALLARAVKLPRKTGAWLMDKKGYDVDYNVYDYGIAEKRN